MINDVIHLIENDELRNDMSENARKYAIQNHSIKNLRLIEKIIFEMLN